jgi:malonyl-CoA O-methyltransferase
MPADAACKWLKRQVSVAGGLPLLSGDSRGACSTTGLALPALTACGEFRLVRDLLVWLLARQMPSGAFPDAAGQPCSVVTADVLRGLLAVCHRPLAKDGNQITGAIEAAGNFLTHDEWRAEAPGSLLSWAPPALELAPLAALYQAGQVLHESRWCASAQRWAQRLRRAHDLTRWNTPTHWLTATAQAMFDLGWENEARHLLALPAACQRPGGEVPALAGVTWVSSSGLAQLAKCWYQTNDRERADAAIAALACRQARDGGFCGSWGLGAAFHPRRQTVATACCFLQAALSQVAASFEQCAVPGSEALAADDGRLLAARQFLTGLPPGSCVADVGCGQGRYLRWLRQWFPQYRWIGIDASAAALSKLPPGVQALEGSLLDLPVENGSLDAVLCVEALEHSLLPRQAIAELCRVLRPGGRLLAIDKQRDFQALSEHQSWEIWFSPAEVCQWIGSECDEVTVTPVTHGPRRAASGLFLCWTGVRRPAAQRQRAA